MSELKPGWKRVKFGEVVRLVKETCKDPVSAGIERVIGLEHIEPGDLRVRRWADIAEGTTFTTRVRPGQVLFGKRRAYQRKVAVADFDAICSGDIYVFESADPTKLLPGLLPFVCLTDAFFEHAIGTSAGSLSPRTNWSSLAQLELCLPPIERQNDYLALLSSLETASNAYWVALKASNKLQQSHLSMYFPIERYSSAMPKLELREVADVRLGYKVTPAHRGHRISKKIITVAQLQDGFIDASDIKEVTIPSHMVDTYRPRNGSLLMTEGGNIDQLGRGSIWNNQINDCIFQNHVFEVRPNNKYVLVEYLEGLMRSPMGREFFMKFSKRTSNLATIDQPVVQRMPVPIITIEQQSNWANEYQSIKLSTAICAERHQKSVNLLINVSNSLVGGLS